ncbi:MAG TPA: metallophosphoesterase [Bryobacteraceae bacterium]|jgi:UDP-2,3-diacylglucosamine pyrophosphatase LpxH
MKSVAEVASVSFMAAAFLLLLAKAAPAPDSFRFVVLGDRTGEARAGVYERIWKEATAEHPAFVLSVGDTIEGLNDETAESEWQQVEKSLSAWSRFPLYLTPGNHDIWSPKSAELFQKYSKHPPHYSFDYRQAHFTILDNSRSDQFSEAELTFLEEDLRQHNSQPLKFIVSHRPSWLLNVIVDNPNFRLHQIAKKYGARYVIAGHVHEMLHAKLEGIDYVSMVSSGGHLRATGKYEDGWFFGYAVVDVDSKATDFRIHELGTPYGKGRSTELTDWGKSGLAR